MTSGLRPLIAIKDPYEKRIGMTIHIANSIGRKGISKMIRSISVFAGGLGKCIAYYIKRIARLLSKPLLAYSESQGQLARLKLPMKVIFE